MILVFLFERLNSNVIVNAVLFCLFAGNIPALSSLLCQKVVKIYIGIWFSTDKSITYLASYFWQVVHSKNGAGTGSPVATF